MNATVVPPSLNIQFNNTPRYLIEIILESCQKALNSHDSTYDTEQHESQQYTLYTGYFIDKDKEHTTSFTPVYERITHQALSLETSKTRNRKECWNCGDPEHEVNQCHQPRDNERIDKTRQALYVPPSERSIRYYDTPKKTEIASPIQMKSPVRSTTNQQPTTPLRMFSPPTIVSPQFYYQAPSYSASAYQSIDPYYAQMVSMAYQRSPAFQPPPPNEPFAPPPPPPEVNRKLEY